MPDSEKRKNIKRYYVQITAGVAFGFINSTLIFYLSINLFGDWWTYLGVVTGVLGLFFGYTRLKIDYQTLRHSLNKL